MRKAIPIGIEFYEEIIDNDYYYVDKTLLIKELLKQKSKVTLFTRPRRFGKTLAQTMLRAFFERRFDIDGNAVDNTKYFAGKKILDAGEVYIKHMGKYPVIFMTLKSAKQPDFEMAYIQLRKAIAAEYRRHDYVLQTDSMSEKEKENYLAYRDEAATQSDYATALQFLSVCLEKYHHEKTIILLDEYDVPLENSYISGFYDEMSAFIRSLFESTLKTNESLAFAVVTGCLRISRESIFTGLNNLRMISILDESYAEYFGFTQVEVDAMLSYYEIEERREEVKSWYDGYLFGQTEVYNPWSVINYVSDIIYKNTEYPKPYWSNTSSNSIVREMVENADDDTKEELEQLIAGKTIEKQVHEDITYDSIHQSQDNLWNFLFFTGYLKMAEKRFESREIYLTMRVPNEETLYIYENCIKQWFEKRMKSSDFSSFYQALLNGDAANVENFLIEQLSETISMYDNFESFYHGFLLGLLSNLKGYKKVSNRESGSGRFDIALKQIGWHDKAVIIELKRCKEEDGGYTKMESLCYEALGQIGARHYDAEFIRDGYKEILKYGICFCGKSCRVRSAAKKEAE